MCLKQVSCVIIATTVPPFCQIINPFAQILDVSSEVNKFSEWFFNYPCP